MDTSGREANIKYDSSKGHHCGIYIFLYKRSWRCSDANNYCGLCTDHFLSLKLMIHLSLLVVDILKSTTRGGQKSLSPVIHSDLIFNLKSLNLFLVCPVICKRRTVLCAFRVETNVEQDGVQNRCFDFIFFSFPLLVRSKSEEETITVWLP